MGPATSPPPRHDLRPLDRPPHAAAHRAACRTATSAPCSANNYSLYGIEPAEVINGYTSLVPEGSAAAVPQRHRLRAASRPRPRLFHDRAGDRDCATSTCSASPRSWSSEGRCSTRFEPARSPEWTPAVETEYVGDVPQRQRPRRAARSCGRARAVGRAVDGRSSSRCRPAAESCSAVRCGPARPSPSATWPPSSTPSPTCSSGRRSTSRSPANCACATRSPTAGRRLRPVLPERSALPAARVRPRSSAVGERGR